MQSDLHTGTSMASARPGQTETETQARPGQARPVYRFYFLNLNASLSIAMANGINYGIVSTCLAPL